jgi:hypothetical protein
MTVAPSRRLVAFAAAALLAVGLGAGAANAASPATTRDVTGFGETFHAAQQNFYAVAASYGYTAAQCTITDIDHQDGSVDWWATGYCTG